MCYEATRNLPTEEVEVETPVAVAKVRVLAGKKLAIVPVLRAGLGMVDTIIDLIPSAKVGHIGLFRDPETHEARGVLLQDATRYRGASGVCGGSHAGTGGSASAAIALLKKKYGCKNITLMDILAAPGGRGGLCRRIIPMWIIILAALDERLNEQAYIVPGLGDAGDRIFRHQITCGRHGVLTERRVFL